MAPGVMVEVTMILSSMASASHLASLNSLVRSSLVDMLAYLGLEWGEQIELVKPGLSPERDEEWLGPNGLNPSGLGLEMTNLGCIAVSGGNPANGSELKLRRPW